jgi:hypothetical protein
LASAGCGRASADPARFAGRQGIPTVAASSIREVKNKPSAYLMLGDVTARCRVDEGVRSMREAWLADVDCSEDLLAAALREKAASVGGELLVGRECTHDEQSRGELWKSTLVSCSAKVAARSVRPAYVIQGRATSFIVVTRPEASPDLPAGESMRGTASPQPGARLEYDSPSQAFRVRVAFTPVAPVRQFAPRDPDHVNELAVLPPSHVVMGDISARCRDDCERAAVRYAVRAAAARVGAPDVVGVACVTAKRGLLCTGRAARPEADPETNMLAR